MAADSDGVALAGVEAVGGWDINRDSSIILWNEYAPAADGGGAYRLSAGGGGVNRLRCPAFRFTAQFTAISYERWQRMWWRYTRGRAIVKAYGVG